MKRCIFKKKRNFLKQRFLAKTCRKMERPPKELKEVPEITNRIMNEVTKRGSIFPAHLMSVTNVTTARRTGFFISNAKNIDRHTPVPLSNRTEISHFSYLLEV